MQCPNKKCGCEDSKVLETRVHYIAGQNSDPRLKYIPIKVRKRICILIPLKNYVVLKQCHPELVSERQYFYIKIITSQPFYITITYKYLIFFWFWLILALHLFCFLCFFHNSCICKLFAKSSLFFLRAMSIQYFSQLISMLSSVIKTSLHLTQIRFLTFIGMYFSRGSLFAPAI